MVCRCGVRPCCNPPHDTVEQFIFSRLARMKTEEWKTYRTRFLVKAKQLNSNLSFVDPLGREHSGRKGDYLVESSDGVVRIAPRHIFEDIYVPMLLEQRAFLPLENGKPSRRKPVQPWRDRRSPGPSLGVM